MMAEIKEIETEMADKDSNPDFDRWCFTAQSNLTLEGRPVPILTKLLYKVCGNNHVRFNQALEILQAAFEAGAAASTHDGLGELKQALEFFDKVKASSKDERAAVGNDHWDWLESAARKAVAGQKADDKKISRYPPDIDPECIPLCDALNALPGIRTFESCCGHGESPHRIYFEAVVLEALQPILEAISSSAWGLRASWANGGNTIYFILEGPAGPAERIGGANDAAGWIKQKAR